MANLEDYSREICETRRAIHRRPEEGWTEFETTYRVVSTLEKYGVFKIKAGRDVIDPEHVLGRNPDLVEKAQKRRGGQLAQNRDGDAAVPAACGFASERDGFMHACGHDGHTATGLGLAHWIADHKDDLNGKIRLIFQPAEEGTRGASAMTAAGAADDLDWFFGAHVGCDCAPGEVGVVEKGFLATTKIDISFTGRASHAGSDPDKGRSALMAAAACALMMQGIPRHGEGDTRVAVGTLRAGEGRNVTPVHAFMQAEVRGATGEINEWMTERVQSIVKGVAESYEVEGKMIKAGEAVDMRASPEAADLVATVVNAIPGLTSRMLQGEGGSEDCSLLMRRAQQKGAKAVYFIYGCKHHGHHRSDFEIQDEKSLPVAFQVMTGIVTRLNGKA